MPESERWDGDVDPLSDDEERRVLFAAIDSFYAYRGSAHYNVTHIRRQFFYALPSAHWELLASPPFSVLDHLSAVDEAIDANADIADAICRTGVAAFGSFEPPNEHPGGTQADAKPVWDGTAGPKDLDKARSTLRQMFRDWSAEGAEERAACYAPVVAALDSEYASVPVAQKGRIRVLVPGAGLGRLVFELVYAGYTAEGNEISYHQLLASSFILNHTKQPRQYSLYPWALSFSNHLTRANQLHKVMIPDVHPGTMLDDSSHDKEIHAFQRMSMSAADFCVAYRSADNMQAFDAVTTVFFIDTAPNLINYIETVRHCLKDGGIWINLGPLLWHFENKSPGKHGKNGVEQYSQTTAQADGGLGIGEAGSVELTHEQVIKLVEYFGFAIERHETQSTSTGYIQDPQNMLVNTYRPVFWIARKKPPA